MNFSIEKIKEEEGLFQGYDSNSDSSLVAPWEYSSRSLHLSQQANVLKNKKLYSTYDNLNDIHDTNQPNITHMKKQQQHGNVTRRLPGDKKFKSDRSADNVNVSSSTSKNEAVALSAPPFIAGIKPPKAGGGDDYERNFCFDTRLSPSSSIMYHHHPHNISPSPSSSKMMLMMDNEYYDIASNNLVARESILMKQALKSKAKKRRESIGESIATTRKRSVSTSIVPRLTKSSVISSQQTLHKRNNSTTTLNHKRRYYSLQQPLSQKDRNNLAAITNDKEEIYLQQQQDGTAGVHWDPHIDAFEILRAKITGITRSMQEFHVQELFEDEKRKKKKLTSTTSSPLITTTSRNNIANRRFSLASSNSFSTFRDDPTTNNNRLSFIGHRRIRSQSCVPLTSPHDLNEKKEYNTHYEEESDDNYDDDDDYNDDMMNIPSPNLTALYLTTNNLIHSRLDELSETASLKSTHDDINEVSSMLVWQKKFLNLVTSCIHQSEELESLSTDVLNTEHRVRELMLINETIHEQFHEREKQYEERIRECQDVAQQQLMMIDSLEELTSDINMKMESRRREIHRQEALLALDANCYKNRDENSGLLDEENNNSRWSFQKSVGDLLNMDDKHDLIQKMRWDIGMFVGGGVGTGHVIHSYEDKLNGIDMMIAGTGTTSTAIQRPYYPVDDDEYNTDDDYTSQTEFYSVSPSIEIEELDLQCYQSAFGYLTVKQTNVNSNYKTTTNDVRHNLLFSKESIIVVNAAISSVKNTVQTAYLFFLLQKFIRPLANGVEFAITVFTI
ncbi:hypothetical protein INT48_002971 [Thamnidium elegans]|uniref:Uncharacterized protein n=1 Tax=Thamnidium elegans TaxID=101142 RepID=A0A8H7SIM2_9FUNG|nr:hypothetical protein INT48_002971 [Thamnidium elegans]